MGAGSREPGPVASPSAAYLRSALAEGLSAQEVERLRELTGDWAINPFEFQTARRAFEVSQEWLSHHLNDSEEDIDLLLKGCEVLTGSATWEGDGERAGEGDRSGGQPEDGSFVLLFDVEDAPGVAEVFRRLLQCNAVYRVGLPAGNQGKARVSVGFRFRSDEEFFRRRQHVYWLRELADRLYRGRPYGGNRVW